MSLQIEVFRFGMIHVSAMLTCRSLAIEDPAMNHVNSWKAWSTTPADESRSSWGPLKIQFIHSNHSKSKWSNPSMKGWCVCVWFPDRRSKNTLYRNISKNTSIITTPYSPQIRQYWARAGSLIYPNLMSDASQPSPRGSTTRLPEDEKFVFSNRFFLRCLYTSRNAPESACAI
jgi:hypothetical protein